MEEENFWESEEIMSEEEARTFLSETLNENQKQERMPENTTENQVLEEEKDDDDDPNTVAQIMNNARLRLEQGRLYEMLLEHNLFQDVQANPIAIQNVEKEIKRFIRERLEVLLGIREDPRRAKTSYNVEQFTPFEVDFLKKLIDKTTNGISKQIKFPPPEHKKATGTIRPVGGQNQEVLDTAKTLGPKATFHRQTVRASPAQTNWVTSKKFAIEETERKIAAPIEEDENLSEKPPHKMTRSELMERNKHITKRQAKRKSFAPDPNRLPMPSPNQAAAISMAQAANRTSNGQTIGGVPLADIINNTILNNIKGENTDE